jgi:hypothetical protein
MRNFSEYYTSRPIQDDVAELSDPALELEQAIEAVNTLVMNVVMKYTALYFGAKSAKISDISEAVSRMLRYGESGPITETDSLRCIADTQSTAALVKEIIFNTRFKTDEAYLGMDLGSGSGILTLASVIAGRRRRVKAFTLGVEIHRGACSNSRSALRKTLGNETEWAISNDDAVTCDEWKRFPGSPSQWISETFSRTTRPLRVKNGKVVYGDSRAMRDPRLREAFEWLDAKKATIDPFTHLLEKTLKANPDFESDVRKGKTAMFPDVINGLFVTSPKGARLKLETSNVAVHQSLPQIGSEFSDYEVLGLGGRWQ